MQDLISEESRRIFASVANGLCLDSIAHEAVLRRAEVAMRNRRYDAPARLLDKLVEEQGATVNLASRRRLVAALALALPDQIVRMTLPVSILCMYKRFNQVLANSINADVTHYDPDLYAKDARFVLGLSVPAGAQAIDLYSRIGPTVIPRQLFRPLFYKSVITYVATGSYGPLLQIHTDPRDVSEFNEAGWDALYLRVAELLLRKPDLAGMVATSWFYDPALLSISPRLAYLQKPFGHGAFRLWIGTSKADIDRASAKSSTRKALIDSGAYQPKSFSLVWPRKALLHWADDFRK